jgi:hypothetical protein
MSTLASDLRSKLERVVVAARDVAEAGARAALEALAVHEPRYYPHMLAEQQKLRNQLRARARQLGDKQEPGGQLTIDHLGAECAYEHWHRMLFARFLAESGILIEPESGMAISLAEAEELAKGAGEDVWTYASRCAERMLPQIFRPDDPLLQVALATEHRVRLEQRLDSLTREVFTASDALGWVYQFWQSKKKDEINRSEVKIGADEIGPVTQLFTEPYMVQFLLDNTLGAWWAGKNLKPEVAEAAESEQELRQKLALPGVPWDYLRFVRGADGTSGLWRPAAGTFDGWPKAVRDVKVLDPCCGSGHFLVAALQHLVPMRMEEEGLSAREAVDEVLRDNIHGLEIDERCCQIAAFALAFAAWTYLGAGGYRPLPAAHIACTGVGPQCSEEEWLRLAEQAGMPTHPVERERIKNGLLSLHRLFSQAPTLGSLIDPKGLQEDLRTADYEAIQPYLVAVLMAEKADDETRERAIAAAGIVEAADLLAGDYALVITNVPYLGRNRQHDLLKEYISKHFKEGSADLATAFLLRSLDFCARGGSTAIVTQQALLFLTMFTELRQELLANRAWNVVVRLGENAFESIAAAGAFAALVVFSLDRPTDASTIAGCDVSAPRGKRPISAREKAALLKSDLAAAMDAARECGFDGRREEDADGTITDIPQLAQLQNPDAAIDFTGSTGQIRLAEYATAVQGIGTGDLPRYMRRFWEAACVDADWEFFHTTPARSGFHGHTSIIHWKQGLGPLAQIGTARKGLQIEGKEGIAVAVTGSLEWAYFLGTRFDCTVGVLVPNNPAHLPAIAAFASDPDFPSRVRGVDQALSVTEANFLKVPFDLAYWQKAAAKKYPDGLPEPESDHPTQWLFHGRPEESAAPLQVAVARLLGYRWPAELDEKMRLSKRARDLVKRCDELLGFADPDGIVCIPSVRGEEPAAKQLEALLAAAGVESYRVRELTCGTDLDEWLRTAFFEEHCRLFHDRPLIWHIWDGRKRDGFHALINYHKLAEGDGKGRKLLESLTYSYLGDWIARQEDGVRRGEESAEGRLAAALELRKRLESILEGAPPFDLFVRWKPLAEQAIGWEPDINDGVRLNIRPFLASDLPNGKKSAGILRSKPNIKWAKDRGKEPQRAKADYPWFWSWDEKTVDFAGGEKFDGNRWNDCHCSRGAKQAARDTANKGGRR